MIEDSGAQNLFLRSLGSVKGQPVPNGKYLKAMLLVKRYSSGDTIIAYYPRDYSGTIFNPEKPPNLSPPPVCW